jgi:hypothetical protein
MSSKNNKPRKKILAFGSEENKILELDAFILQIEKDFFCNVSIVNMETLTITNDLVLDIQFNFNLNQGLSILAKGKLEGHDLMLQNEEGYFFLNALEKLRNETNNAYDIKELNLVFNDCTVVLHRIFENSISLVIDQLILELYKNHIYITKGLTEQPYEIHIPVIEDNNFYKKNKLLSSIITDKNQKNYCGFWGLYFDNKVDCDIYDSQLKKIIRGELTMLE